MITLNLSDIENKKIVDINTGKNIGNIIDININSDGYINSLVIEEKNRFSFAFKDEIEVKWKDIKKIGEDVILVDLK